MTDTQEITNWSPQVIEVADLLVAQEKFPALQAWCEKLAVKNDTEWEQIFLGLLQEEVNKGEDIVDEANKDTDHYLAILTTTMMICLAVL